MKISQLTEKFAQEWLQANEEEAFGDAVISHFEKKIREEQVDKFLKTIKKFNPEKQINNGNSSGLSEFFLVELRGLFKRAFSYQSDQIDLMFSTEMMKSTKLFAKQARGFDSALPIPCIFQACRNVWIMNGLQLILGYPVELTPSIFAYSMLYPYTDNFVDDPTISKTDKLAFSVRFALRLAGEKVLPKDIREHQIYQLVEMIENQYDREQYPEVFQSLLGIHQAQTESMALLEKKQTSFNNALHISIAKGGASVLADGFLIAGRLTEEQEYFLFGYGAYLQLLDDVQDVKEDLESDLMTAFSLAAQEQKLDRLIHKTINFGEKILIDSKDVLDQVALDFRGLLQKSIRLFLIESVAIDSQYYSANFQSNMESRSPLTFRFIRERKNFFTPQKHLLLEKLEVLASSRATEQILS